MNASEPRSSLWSRLVKAGCVALLLGGNVFLAGMSVFIGNPLGFNFLLAEALAGMAIVGVSLFVGVWLIQGLLMLPPVKIGKGNGLEKPAGLLFLWLGVCMWIQGNLSWNIHTNMGELVHCGEHPVFTVLELVIFAVILALFIWARRWIWKNASRLVFIVLGCQVLVLVPSLLGYSDSDYTNKTAEFGTDSTYEFSTRQNVIIIILDSYGNDYFQEVRAAYPSEVETGFKDFTYFDHFVSPIPWTAQALPCLLTGEAPEMGFSWLTAKSRAFCQYVNEVYESETSLLKRFSQSGSRTIVHPMPSNVYLVFPLNADYISNLHVSEKNNELSRLLVDELLSHVAYRLSPLCVKVPAYNFVHEFQWEMYGLFQRIFDPNCPKRTVAGKEKEVEKSPSSGDMKAWFDTLPPGADPLFANMPQRCALTEQPVLQVYHLVGIHYRPGIDLEGVKRIAVRDLASTCHFLRTLRANGVYDNSYIVILGDHGFDRREAAMKAATNPMLLIKRPGEQHDAMALNQEVVMIYDLAPTLLAHYGFELEKPRSLWNFTEAQRRERLELWNTRGQ